MGRIPPEVREVVLDRAGGACECCGVPFRLKIDMQHRRAHKMGGDKNRAGQETVENIIALEHDHHMWWTRHPTLATEYGISVSSWDDPAVVPVRVSTVAVGKC